MKFLPPASAIRSPLLDKLDAHCPDKRAYLCRLLRRSRATGSVFQLFRKPGAVGSEHAKDAQKHTRRVRGAAGAGGPCVRVVERKIELTFVKLGAACVSRRCRT